MFVYGKAERREEESSWHVRLFPHVGYGKKFLRNTVHGYAVSFLWSPAYQSYPKEAFCSVLFSSTTLA